jgi:hypothetical protein
MSSLAESLAQKRKEQQAAEVCVVSATSGQVVAFIEFWPTPHNRLGYGAGQLLHYQLLTRNPGHDPAEMPQVLTLGFATADVVVSGKRLEAVAELLVEGRLKSLAVLPERFAELNPRAPFVAKIDVKPVREDAGGTPPA